MIQYYMILALALFSTCAAAADNCNAVGHVAQSIAQLRNGGMSEDGTATLTGSAFVDSDRRKAADTLVHSIYTDPQLKALSPEAVRKKVMALCEEK